MGRKCTVCIHPQRDAIDKALLDVSVSMEEIANTYGLSVSAILRHKSGHLPKIMSKAIQERASKGETELFDGAPAAVVPPAIRDHEVAEQEHAQDLQETQHELTEREIKLGGTLLDRLDDLTIRAKDILQTAQKASALKTALAAIGRVADLLELEAKLVGQLKENQVNLVQNVIYLPAVASEEEWLKLAKR